MVLEAEPVTRVPEVGLPDAVAALPPIGEFLFPETSV